MTDGDRVSALHHNRRPHRNREIAPQAAKLQPPLVTGPSESRPGYSNAMPSWDSIVDVFDIQALSHTVLDRPRTWALQQRWREVFAAETRAETGKWVVGGFEWHSLIDRAEDGARALALYQRQENRPVWVLPVTEYGNSALGFR